MDKNNFVRFPRIPDKEAGYHRGGRAPIDAAAINFNKSTWTGLKILKWLCCGR
jgi:hypothetical protein